MGSFYFEMARQGTCPPVPHPQTESNLILFSPVFYYTVTKAADKRQKDLVTVSVRGAGGWRRGKLVLSWVVVRSWSRSGLSQPPIVVHLIKSIVLHLAAIGWQLEPNEHCTEPWGSPDWGPRLLLFVVLLMFFYLCCWCHYCCCCFQNGESWGFPEWGPRERDPRHRQSRLRQ